MKPRLQRIHNGGGFRPPLWVCYGSDACELGDTAAMAWRRWLNAIEDRVIAAWR